MEDNNRTNQQVAKQNQEITFLNSPEQYLPLINPKTALDIVNSPNPSLVRMMLSQVEIDGVMQTIIDHRKEIKVKAIMTMLILQTLDFFSVGKSMSAPQVAQTVELIIEDMSVYKIDYFVLCFKRAKKGNYGTIYDCIDGRVILEWLNKFNTEYSIEIENERAREKRKFEKPIGIPDPVTSKKDEQTGVPMPDYFRKFLEVQQKKKLENLTPKVPQRSPEQLVIDGFIADFNALVRKNEEPTDRFAVVDGISYDAAEYIKYRFDALKKGSVHKKRLNRAKRLSQISQKKTKG